MNSQIEEHLFTTYFNLFESEEIRSDETLSCMAWGFECGDGWSKLIEDMIKKIQQIVKEKQLTDFHFEQIKEKWGTLRVYTSNSCPEIDKVIEEAEHISAVTCEICGAPGKTRGGSWVQTLCDIHSIRPEFDVEKEANDILSSIKKHI
jgi:hypothetical protein